MEILHSFQTIVQYHCCHQFPKSMNMLCFTKFSNISMIITLLFGFRPGHFTELDALKITDNLTKQMDKMKIPINIYIDLSKAFDTLNHSILIEKLLYYGICGNENNLICNYLSGRHQYVDYNGAKSKTQMLTTGVPQGSILGPLLFLIYINDLPSASAIFDMLMYADDTTLYCNLNEDINEFEINNELNKINTWLSSNKLCLNIKKTKFMIFHSNHRTILTPRLTINNIDIECVKQFNFLGLILNSQLTWTNHIEHIAKKISRVIGVLYRLKQIYPQAVLLMLYNALIVPHFSYCILIWGSKISNGHALHLSTKKYVKRGLCSSFGTYL